MLYSNHVLTKPQQLNTSTLGYDLVPNSDPDLNVTSCTRSAPDSEFFLLVSHTDPLTDTSKIASTSPRSSTMNSTRAPCPSHSPTSTGPMRSTTPSTPSTTSSSPPSSSTAWPSASPVSP